MLRRPVALRMIRLLLLWIAAVCGQVFLASPSSVAAEADAPREAVTASIDQLQRWLGASRYGGRWNEYLKTDQLLRELAKGNAADNASLQIVLDRYQSDASGLEKPRFVAVREALAAYLASRRILPVDSLATAAGKADQDFTPPSSARVAAAEAQTAAAARRLNRFLAQNSDREKNWKTFLRWPALEDQLKSEDTDTAALAQVLQRFSADEPGLEKSQFVAVRRNLRVWIDRALAEKKTAAVAKKIKAFSRELAMSLQDYGADASHWDAMRVAARVNFLERFDVAPELTASVRHHYSHPNLSAYISSDLISSAMDRVIDESIAIRESIMGVSIVGEGQTKGKLQIELLPDEQRAALGLKMTGVTESQTVGSKRSVRVYADSTTSLAATKEVHFGADGFSTRPAEAQASTQTRVTGLSTRRGNRFVERLAWRKVAKTKGQAQRQSSQRAAMRLEDRMDEEGDKLLTGANEKYAEKFRGPLLRKDAFPNLFEVNSSDQQIRLLMHEASADQLAAPIPATSPPAGSDLAFHVHESFVNNMAAHLLGGKRISSDDAAKQEGEGPNFLERFQAQREKKVNERRAAEGKPPLAKKKPTKKEEAPWQMRFAKRNPFSVEFREGTIRFVVRGIEFSGLDDQVYDRPMSMWAHYRVEQDGNGGLRLTLLDLGVDPTSVERGQRFVAADAPLRSKLRVRWKETLEGVDGENKVIEVFPFELPDAQFKQVGPLAYESLGLAEGWLTLGLQRTVDKVDRQAAVD